jgi:hypothetical protein
MSLTIRAHFDGKVIVPDEPLYLPAGQVLEVDVRPSPQPASPSELERQRAAVRRVVSRAVHGLHIPPEALRREALYEESL